MLKVPHQRKGSSTCSLGVFWPYHGLDSVNRQKPLTEEFKTDKNEFQFASTFFLDIKRKCLSRFYKLDILGGLREMISLSVLLTLGETVIQGMFSITC